MISIIGSSIDLLVAFIALSLCRRYVFLEKDLEGKKQQYFNLCSILLLVLCNIVLGNNLAQLCLVLIAGLNISFARKKHRIIGYYLILPIMGIVNGIMVPFLFMFRYIFGMQNNDSIHADFADVCLIFAELLFYVKGKEWRNQFETQMGDRRLQKWETALLCVVGVLMNIFSNII